MEKTTLKTNQNKFSKPQTESDEHLSVETIYDFTNNYTTDKYFDEINDWLNDHYGTNNKLK